MIPVWVGFFSLLRRGSEHRSVITDELSASAADPQTLPVLLGCPLGQPGETTQEESRGRDGKKRVERGGQDKRE